MAKLNGKDILFSPNITIEGEPIFRYSTMPTASSDYSGKIVEFIGATTADYTQGYFYKCVGSGTPTVYEWQQIDVQPHQDISGKVDKVTGKGLSTNDFTDYYKNKIGDKYEKPVGGIPKTDLASDVQTSLGKADTALQQHQDISGKLDVSKVKSSASTTSGDVYDVTYINVMLGDIESLLQALR